MSLAVDVQPDQTPERWDDHVAVYEEVLEPLANVFAGRTLDLLDLGLGDRSIDVGAGAGGAALIAAARGSDVVAIDTSPQMAARIAARANGSAGTTGGNRREDYTRYQLDSCSPKRHTRPATAPSETPHAESAESVL